MPVGVPSHGYASYIQQQNLIHGGGVDPEPHLKALHSYYANPGAMPPQGMGGGAGPYGDEAPVTGAPSVAAETVFIML